MCALKVFLQLNNIRMITKTILFCKTMVMRAIDGLFRLSIARELPRITAFLLVVQTKKVNAKKKYKVLCLTKFILTDDIDALAKFGSDVQYLVLPLKKLRIILEYFLGEYSKEIDANNYYVDERFAPGIKRFDISSHTPCSLIIFNVSKTG